MHLESFSAGGVSRSSVCAGSHNVMVVLVVNMAGMQERGSAALVFTPRGLLGR